MMGMGFGLMGAGAAVKGLVGGYQQGRKFAQDEERFDMEKEKFGLEKKAAEQVGRLRDEQIKGAGLANRKAQGELDDEDQDRRDVNEMAGVFRDLYTPRQAPVEAPAAPVQGVTPPAPAQAPAPAAAGLAGPGAAAAQAAAPAAPAAAAPQARPGPTLDQLQEAYSRANAIGLRSILRKQGAPGAVNLALQMGRAFDDAKTDAAIRALHMYDGSNEADVNAALAQAGLKMPEGTRFERRQIEVLPGSGIKSEDVVAISPDGKTTRSLHQMMRSRMAPKEVFDMDTNLGKAAAEIALRATAEQNLQEFRKRELDIRERSARDQADYYLKSLQMKEQELGFQREARRDASEAQTELRKSQVSRNALGEIMQLSGVSRETSAKDMEMLSDTERARISAGLARSFTAHTIWSMNAGALSPAESIEVARRVAADPKAVKVDSGQASLEFGGKQVFVPAPLTQPGKDKPGPAGAKGSVEGAAPAPAPAALAPPSAADAQRQFRAVSNFVRTQKVLADQDPELAQLKSQADDAMRRGRGAEVNNILAQRAALLRERYNLTPLGGVADPSRLQQ